MVMILQFNQEFRQIIWTKKKTEFRDKILCLGKYYINIIFFPYPNWRN